MDDVVKIEKTVHAAVLAMLSDKASLRRSVSNHDHIVADLGFTSLDLAVILAQLEISLEGDPFAEIVPITSVRTVGDICDAYRKLFAGEGPSAEAEEQGAIRAKRRLRASGKSE